MRLWWRSIIAVLGGCLREGKTWRPHEWGTAGSGEPAPTWRSAPLRQTTMRIPCTKAHGAKNDFLLTRSGQAPRGGLPEIARAICDRHTGVGADGWMLLEP